MKIILSPFRPLEDAAFELSKVGDVITINGIALDFGPLADGAMLEPEAIDSAFIAGPVRRVDGALELCILVPMPAKPTPEQANPAPLINPDDGVLMSIPMPSLSQEAAP
ncbi:hypothetical protein GB928_018800 [Shinella curvata]|uniref:Uncharacterized protein n=1 Tax=Shinella curvata TaxID=1817964 RepID=A0ABT8XHS8_9HYPH|nr:hypothetical protein [Shinella curvata]MCJ8053910.1 hypothetical protein [Shinella curvata]MDO6123242.1 hypothetical protein [Shinella curvata]